MRCPVCENDVVPTANNECPNCLVVLSVGPATVEVDDELVEAASIPDLGAMLRRGKKKGFIQPAEEGSGKAV